MTVARAFDHGSSKSHHYTKQRSMRLLKARVKKYGFAISLSHTPHPFILQFFYAIRHLLGHVKNADEAAPLICWPVLQKDHKPLR